MSLRINDPMVAKAFQEAIKNGEFGKAGEMTSTIPMGDALVYCLGYLKTNQKEFDFLRSSVESRGYGISRIAFIVRTALTGFVPAEPFADLTDSDYDEARMFILAARDAEQTLTSHFWKDNIVNAKLHSFYPEFSGEGLRQRIRKIAEMHVGKGPGDAKQTALFSLGGMFGLATSTAGTKPQGAATTCILVARSIWHASGINVINGKQTLVFVPKGLSGEMPMGELGYVKADDGNLGNVFIGDIFHIKGDNFPNSGNDSTHVGIITSVIGSGDSIVWNTIEGGSNSHITKRNQRKLVKIASGTYKDKWAFENDTETKVGRRPIQGWYSVNKISSGRLM